MAFIFNMEVRLGIQVVQVVCKDQMFCVTTQLKDSLTQL